MQLRHRIMAALLLPTVAFAAGNKPGPKKDKAEQPATIRSFVQNETERLEGEMAVLIQQKAAVAASGSAWLDLRIDSRVISRWVCQQLLNVDAMSDAQAVAWLRYQDALSLSATLDGANLLAPPTPPQTAALLKIHKSTFDMKDATDIASIDGYLTTLRDPLLIALNAKKADQLRPPPASVAGTTGTRMTGAQPTEAVLTLESMSTRVTQLSISVGLRQQLLAAIGMAKAAPPEDAEKITGVLRDALGMASMLQTNFAVDPDARAQMEKDLGTAVVLYSDARVRESGLQKLEGLKQYRALAERVAAMKLSPDLLKIFAPALRAARDQPESADKILSAIEQFAGVDTRMAAKHPSPPTDAASRAAEQQLKNYAAQRAAVLAAATSAETLPDEVAKLKQTADLYDLLKSLPQTQAQLLALHPRPTGGVEKRITQAIVHGGADGDPLQEESIKTLTTVGEFVSNWQVAQSAMQKPIDDDAMKACTGKSWADASAAVKALAADLANALATGGELDDAKIKSLGRLPAVLKDIRRFAALSAALGDGKALARWVDCDLDAAKLAAVLQGYQSDFSAASSGTIEGSGDDDALAKIDNRYRGLLNTLEVIAAAQPACEKMPSDLGWLICRLTTPSEHTLYEAPIRKLCWTNDLITLLQAEPDGGGAIPAQLHDEMLQALSRMVPVPPAAP